MARELREETGLIGRPGKIVGVYSGPTRDPRKPVTTVAFLIQGSGGIPRGADDASWAGWVAVKSAHPLAFDHDRIVRDAVRLLRRKDGGRVE